MRDKVLVEGYCWCVCVNMASRGLSPAAKRRRVHADPAPDPAPELEPAPKTKQPLSLQVTLLRSLLKAKQDAEKKRQHELMRNLVRSSVAEEESGTFCRGRGWLGSNRVVGKWAVLVAKLDAQRSLANEDVALDLLNHDAVTFYGTLRAGSKKTTRSLRRVVAIYVACSLWVKPGYNEEWLRGSVRRGLSNVGLEGEKRNDAQSQILGAFAHLVKDIGSPWIFSEFVPYAQRRLSLRRRRDRRRARFGDGDDEQSEDSDHLGLFFG